VLKLTGKLEAYNDESQKGPCQEPQE